MKAEDWDEKYAATPELWGRGPNAFLRQQLAEVPPGVAVDLACGEGRNAAWLGERGWSVTGVDFSPVAIEQAARRPVGVEWVCADVTTWQPRATPLDLVLIAYLHLPMPELAGVLRRAASWLAEGGRLLYLGHARSNLRRGVGGPPDAGVLPDIADLGAATDGLRVDVLRHLHRETDAGTAIDILLDATRWPTA
ncbi:MAG: class I SAM-dependent methyltransferase [Sciscionella sp.]